MLSFGKHITQKDDLLTSVEVQHIYNIIKHPDETMLNLINRLRLVRTIDKKQYGVMKRELPYIVCGIFNPPYRRIENFGYIEYFIIDIDHIAEKGMELNTLRTKLITDNRIMLCFVSPSEDGLKVLFRLNEKCYDSGQYSLFYKTFIRAYATQHGFEQVVDTVTSDVSRACFMSYDSDAFFNPDAETIKMNDYVDFDNPFIIGEIKRDLKKEEKEQKTEKPEKPVPDDTAIAFIKERLQAKTRTPRQKPQIYVPDELEQILEKLLQYIGESGIRVESVENIQYGKKFRFRAGVAQAEVNLFFGKRGFSVVKSPKQGTSEHLNDLLVSYINSFIEDYVLINSKPEINLSLKQLSDFEIISRQANALMAEKNYADALPLYRSLWEGFHDKCNEWDGWRYAFCLKQLKNFTLALDICRQTYKLNRDFEPVKGLYAWCIYYTEITKHVEDESNFIRAAEAITGLAKQDDKYSAYQITVFKVLEYLTNKLPYQPDKILEWTVKLNSQLLDDNVFIFNDKEGKERETASKKEQYYMMHSRALLEKGEFNECIRICEEGLRTFDKLHYDNNVWFRWRIALSYEGLGEFEKSLNLQLELLKTKNEWFIQKEIAEQYYQLGDYEKSLQYALDSALNSGDTNKKINTYIVLAKSLNHFGKHEEACLHENLIASIKNGEQNKDAENELRRIWNSLKFDAQQQYTGKIKSILPNGKAGFVEADKGKSYYFSLREFRGKKEKAQVNQSVTFYLEEGFDVKKNRKTMNAVKLEISK